MVRTGRDPEGRDRLAIVVRRWRRTGAGEERESQQRTVQTLIHESSVIVSVAIVCWTVSGSANP